MNGRTIRIFLADGSANGVLTAEIINWTGKVIIAPRSQLADLAKRNEIQRTGVYILSGQDPNSSFRERVYIGESDKVLQRLGQHNNDPLKDFWERTLIIISKDENITKAHVRYLESRLIQIGMQAQRASLANGTTPPKPALPESDIADMEYFLSQLQILLPVLGFTFALPVPTSVQSPPSAVLESRPLPGDAPRFVMSVAGANAEAQQIGGEFILLKGSTLKKQSTDTLGETLTELRHQLFREGKLVDSETDPQVWVATTDLPFNSPTAAAKAVGGVSLNGPVYWKVKGTSQTYKAWQEAQIAAATATESELQEAS
jgi:hypothetical protein